MEKSHPWALLVTILSLFVSAFGLEINSDMAIGGVMVGWTYYIEYSPKDNVATTFVLGKGPSTNIVWNWTLTTTATGGNFSWTVGTTLADGDNYILRIQRPGETPNYSSQFRLRRENTITVQTEVEGPSSPQSATSVSLSSSASLAPSLPSQAPSLPSTPSVSSSGSDSEVTTGPIHAGADGLSTGAKAGIGVGATIGGLVLVVGAFCLGRRARERPHKTSTEAETRYEAGKPELDGRAMYQCEVAPKRALQAQVAEMEARISRTEIDSQPIFRGT